MPVKTWYNTQMHGEDSSTPYTKNAAKLGRKRFIVAAYSICALTLSGCIPQVAGPPNSDLANSGLPNTGSRDVRFSSASRVPANVQQLQREEDAWEAKPVTRNAVLVRQDSYIVKPGDTLRGIGNITGAGSEALALANNLKPPFTIYPGQKLAVPTGRFHKVNGGETGIAIARAYGVAWRDIVSLNGLEEPYILRIDQRLQLPAYTPQNAANSAFAVPSNALEKRAASFSLDIDDIVTGGQPALAENVRPSSGTLVPTKAGLDVPINVPAGFTGKFQWPASGPLLSSFGSKGSGKVNDGISIAAGGGSSFKAAGDGVVAYTGNAIPSLGNLVLVDHGSGWVTAYGHADTILVARGQKVKAGQSLGTVGQSGLVDRPQLHFEVRRNRKPVDPITRLPPR